MKMTLTILTLIIIGCAIISNGIANDKIKKLEAIKLPKPFVFEGGNVNITKAGGKYIGDFVPPANPATSDFQLYIVDNIKIKDGIVSYRPNHTKEFGLYLKYPVHDLFRSVPMKDLNSSEYENILKQISLANQCLIGYLNGWEILVYSEKNGYLESIQFNTTPDKKK